MAPSKIFPRHAVRGHCISFVLRQLATEHYQMIFRTVKEVGRPFVSRGVMSRRVDPRRGSDGGAFSNRARYGRGKKKKVGSLENFPGSRWRRFCSLSSLGGGMWRAGL